MKFKEWLELDETRFKGLYRQFRTNHPDMPDHVAKDLYNNRISYSMSNVVNPYNSQDLPTQKWHGTPSTPVPFDSGVRRTANSTVPSNAPSKIMGTHNLGEIQWSKAPMRIKITPLSFDEWTLRIMMQRRFGFKEDRGIRDDANRMNTQRKLMHDGEEGANEPIIVIQNGDKFRLMEGWHRTMNYLVFDHNEHIGAPLDQIEVLKSGDLRKLDFSRWQPVIIQAFVGTVAKDVGYAKNNYANKNKPAQAAQTV